jgi:primosomal protein N' (replication factor Y) (superfamily II helicase)
MNYYKVAPLTHINSSDGLLTYSYEESLQRGELVTIPLRTGAKQAIVTEETNRPSFETKSISEKVATSPVISDERIKVAEFISQEYFCTLGEALSAMLPVTFGKNRRPVAEKPTKQGAIEITPSLTKEQDEVFKGINKQGPQKPHLLFGVTGSGKTEIYLQLIAKVLAEGKGAIVLVPEISLTPQTVSRFRSRFGSTVALLHSNLKETEKFSEWQKIQNGEKKVVIGPRSALFAPVDNLGAIIIDESHESSYKQDSTPRYQAVKVAEKLTKLTGAYLVLGSATPTVEQLYEGDQNNYNLHILNNRIIQTGMPVVEIVDMRNEYHYGNKSIFSEKLQLEIKDALSRKRQILLFLNRRGMSTFVSCRECGHVEKCDNCDIPLTFHYEEMILRCHHCDMKKTAPSVCPKCNSMAIKYFGSGTQRVEQEIAKLFGSSTKTIRMDSDTTKTAGSHEEIFRKIHDGDIDIIIGTQMIAKGWDIGNIDLIGIVSADIMINLPDYAALERAFSLLVQVSGRAGRGHTQGKVVVQTYSPDLDIFHELVNHDFNSFYKKTLENRRELSYPPFAKIVNLLYNSSSDDEAKEESKKTAERVSALLTDSKINFQIVGPSPAFIPKIRNKYRWQITIKLPLWDTANTQLLNNIFTQTLTKGWVVDVDPNGI